MHALVYFIVRFIYVTLGLGSGGRGPDGHRDIHLDPISQDRKSTRLDSSH